MMRKGSRVERESDIEESRRIGRNSAKALADWLLQEYMRSVREEDVRRLDGRAMFESARTVFDDMLREQKPGWDGPPADPAGNGNDLPPDAS
jgi:hypothetical protein